MTSMTATALGMWYISAISPHSMEKDVEQLLRIKATKNVFCLFFTLLSRKRLYNMNSDIKSADIEKHIDNIRLHNPRQTTKIQIEFYH